MILKETDDSVQKEKKKKVEAYTTKDGKKYQALTITVK